MAATHEVAPDALPYFDQGYDDPGVREMVRLLTSPNLKFYLSSNLNERDVKVN